MGDVLFTKQDILYKAETVVALSKAGNALNESKDVYADAYKLVARSSTDDAASTKASRRG